jgi:hypothetical protein
MTIAAALYLLCLSSWLQQQPPAPATNSAPSEAVQRLIELLPPNSMWRNMMEHGAKGDGVRQHWMDGMRKQGLKLATLTFEFDWVQGGAELKDWQLVSVEYFISYDSLGTGTAKPLTNPDGLKAIHASGLEADLEAVGLARAKRGIWVEDPGHQHPPREAGRGYKQVFLAEDEWLPVQMFPWFAAYGEGTTPLMHAALLGDIERLKTLLAQGAPVNAVSSDGSTALLYASEGKGPDTVQALLVAGADPNIAANDGSTALMTAAAADDLRSVGLLLKAGANPNARDADGNSAVSIATQRDHAEIVKLLRHAGARE